jgi:hypothetical protein
MADTNEANADVATEEKGDTEQKQPETVEKKDEPTEYRPKLTDEEQLAIIEGRRRRLLKKLGKADDDAPKSSSKPDTSDLVEKTFLRTAGITDADEVELARDTAKKWGMPIDQLVDDEDFKEKLEKARTKKANEAATSAVKASPGSSGAKDTAEHWVAKGEIPTPDQVSNRKVRAQVAREIAKKQSSNGKTFYND